MPRRYQAPTLEQAEANLPRLAETWGSKYAMAVKSWEKHWDDLTTFFAYPAEIRRIIYTTNSKVVPAELGQAKTYHFNVAIVYKISLLADKILRLSDGRKYGKKC